MPIDILTRLRLPIAPVDPTDVVRKADLDALGGNGGGPGQGVPPGGAENFYLAKTSAADFAMEWRAVGSLDWFGLATFNTAVGTGALNTVFPMPGGMGSGYGTYNTAVGTNALFSVNIGSWNVAVGAEALLFTESVGNTAVGDTALRQSTTERNTAVGLAALGTNSGVQNTAVGQGALRLIWGNRNTALGSEAGWRIGQETVQASDSIFLGALTGVAENGQTNQIVIGTSATGRGSGSAQIGNPNVTVVARGPGTATAWDNVSDPRLKDEIAPADLDVCCAAVTALPVSRFCWRPEYFNVKDRHATGWLAGDVEKVFPKAVTAGNQYFPQYADGKPVMKPAPEEPRDPRDGAREFEDMACIENCKMTDMTEALPTLWGAVQRLIQKNEELEREVARLSGTGDAH